MTRRNFPPRWLGTTAVEEADGEMGRVGGLEERERLYFSLCAVGLGVAAFHMNAHHAPSDKAAI